MTRLLEYIILSVLLYCYDYTIVKGKLNMTLYGTKHCGGISQDLVTLWYIVFDTVEGRVRISPSEVAPVCDGGQLEFNCTIIGSTLEWKIIPEKNHSQLNTIRYVPINDQWLQYGNSTLSFIRSSRSMQLTSSRIVISPVFNNLDGTRIQCTDLADQDSSSTVINVVNAQGNVVYTISIPQTAFTMIDNCIIQNSYHNTIIIILADHGFQQTTIIVRVVSEHFNRDDVKVSLEWIPENPLYSYHVHITPQPLFLTVNLSRSSVQLKVLYNVLYNLSVVKMSPCGQTRAGSIIELYYGECHTHVGSTNLTVKGT